jgi:phosphoglycolate phosphatase
VMIGDHRNDIAAAQGAGVPAVYAGWGYGLPDMAAGAAAIAASPDALPALLAGGLRRGLRHLGDLGG